MSRYHDRDGRPIDLYEWAHLMEDQDYKRVQWDLVNGRWYVSTVWLGLDHNWWGGAPLIFETMVFSQDGTAAPYDEWEMRRYHTEQDARRGHAEMVALVHALDDVREPAKDPCR